MQGFLLSLLFGIFYIFFRSCAYDEYILREKPDENILSERGEKNNENENAEISYN